MLRCVSGKTQVGFRVQLLVYGIASIASWALGTRWVIALVEFELFAFRRGASSRQSSGHGCGVLKYDLHGSLLLVMQYEAMSVHCLLRQCICYSLDINYRALTDPQQVIIHTWSREDNRVPYQLFGEELWRVSSVTCPLM